MSAGAPLREDLLHLSPQALSHAANAGIVRSGITPMPNSNPLMTGNINPAIHIRVLPPSKDRLGNDERKWIREFGHGSLAAI